MSVYHKDKATSEQVQNLKVLVLDLLAGAGVDLAALDIRALLCYGGDVRVYLGSRERTNSRTSFRRTGVAEKSGSVTVYKGTRGVHSTVERDCVVFNIEDFEVPRKLSMIDHNIYEIKKYLNLK